MSDMSQNIPVDELDELIASILLLDTNSTSLSNFFFPPR